MASKPTDRAAIPPDTFERVIRAVKIAYYEWDLATDEMRASPALVDLFGHNPESFGRQRHWQLIHPDDLSAYRAETLAAFKSGADRLETIYRLKAADGTYRWVRNQAMLERDAAGRVTRMVGAVSDITEATQRAAENRALIARQAATIEVLKTISASPDDTKPVFDLIARRARELCDAQAVTVHEYDGTLLHLRAMEGHAPAAAAGLRQAFPRPAGRETMPGRTVLAGQVWHIHDLQADPEIFQPGRALGIRSGIGVPLLRDGRVIGTITLARFEIKNFNASEVALVESFAEQAVIAIASATALHELRQRTGDLQESLEYQTATSDVLKTISRSTFDLQPMFGTMLECATRLCGADFGILWLTEGDQARAVALRNVPPALAEYYGDRAHHAGPHTLVGKATQTRAPIQVADARADEAYVSGDPLRRASVDLGGIRTLLGVPLVRKGESIGVLAIFRQEVRLFTDKQISLLQNFADQAVIAIENARLITEQREALEQQTATAEVLQVINASPGNLTPVFDAMLDKAMRLCGAAFGLLYTYDGERFDSVATLGVPAALAEFRAKFPPAVRPDSPPGRLLTTKRPVHVLDAMAEPGYPTGNPSARAMVDLGHARTILLVPLLKDESVVGMITIYRQEVRAFSDKQVALLQNFAAQAVIAMENARLLGELQTRTAELAARNNEFGERIEQQSATIDVLKVMSASPGDPQPVFDLIAERARTFCQAEAAAVTRLYDNVLHLQAHSGRTQAAAQAYEAAFPRPVNESTVAGRAILARDAVQITDVQADPAFGLKSVSSATALRSVGAVPMLRAGIPIGAIALARSEPGAFSATQVELLQTFAEQAVIAIASAETYRELQERTAALAERNSEFGERIEQQSATIDVLKVMSSTPDDTQPVFDLITQRAQELCNVPAAALLEFDGEFVHLRSFINNDIFNTDAFDAYERLFPMLPTRGSISCRAILDRQIVHVRDLTAEAGLLPVIRAFGHKSQISLPLLRDGVAIGAIVLSSAETGGFSDSQVALLQTFAEQAVIAIASVATFRELRERTAALSRSVAELQALEEVLRAVNSSLDLDTVLSTIISRAVQLSQADEGTIYEYDETEEVFVPKAAFGMTEERVAALRERRIKLGETHLGRSALLRAPVYVSDVQQDPSMPTVSALLEGIHAVMAVPLLRESKVIGGMVIRRRTVGEFAPTLATLLQTFAGQSVLAIENARLFQQLAARGEEASRARIAAEATLADLRRTQDRLVQSEKMASLGQLTAGIAHEIKNPLNFVNNFSELSSDLLDELRTALTTVDLSIDTKLRAEIEDLTATLQGNLQKIAEHGRRADSIVKNMLLHSRTGPSERRAVNLNTTAEEALNLAYHGARAEIPGFNITLEKDFSPDAGTLDIFPQEFIRVLLNLISNGFYAARKRAQQAEKDFEPTLRLTTRDLGEEVEIRVRDNGSGISVAIREKIFEPFFTTKPAGEGTGLGLSLSYDIVVKQHGGQLAVDSIPGIFTEFTITLPRTAPSAHARP